MKISPGLLRFILNIYGPYFGAGVKVEYIAPDWKEIRVSMKLRWYNRNIVGTHFGGSLYSMVDPHLMLMLMQLLGPDYLVWDKAASIQFVRPGRGRVTATMKITDLQVDEICQALEHKSKITPEYDVKVMDEKNKLVASIHKILYIRKK